MYATITIEGKSYSSFPDLVQGDFGTELTFNIKENDGTAYNISGMSVRFKAKKYGASANQINGLCTISNATSGIAVYSLASDDLDDYGRFETELECSSPTKIISAKLGDLIIQQENPN